MPSQGSRPAPSSSMPGPDLPVASSSPSSSTRSCCDGKKSIAEHIVYGAFEIIEQKTGAEPARDLQEGDRQRPPAARGQGRRVGGATYQVPVEVKSRRSTTLAIRWLVGFSRKRREKTMAERLANEILDAANGIGRSVKKREDLLKMAESNKAFSHYRW